MLKVILIPFLGTVLGSACVLLLLDNVVPHMHVNHEKEGPKSGLSETTMLVFAVTLHNIPEGMAVGFSLMMVLDVALG